MAQATRANLRDRLRELYFGAGPAGRKFRYGLIVFDLVTLAIFIIASVAREQWWLLPLDALLGSLLTLELAARVYADRNRREALINFSTLADLIVIASLFLALFIDNLGFLRVVRSLRLLRSFQLLRDLRAVSPWFRRNEDVLQRSLNLGVFIFVITSIVYVTQNDFNPSIASYVDALYFTITTLTTTGFGDITLIGPGGRILAVIIMVVGVGLFLRLLQAVFRPYKVRHECPDCALQVHDIDAVHCKHCGRVLFIKNEGEV
ncbi:MAG: two pore domain potassium channel family protein [Hyphomicrobiales bacterium]|jgi:voltage-gated potassium channel|nr:two pore domain potassium channel family protein [Hyphomicrobiales bacterium]